VNKDFVAIIPAAGKSERFLGETPKQFIKVDGRSILELSLIPLLDFSECKGICVVVPLGDQYHKPLEILESPKISVIEGSNSRMRSVKLGLDFWKNSKISYDFVLIHDAVRPCLRSSDVKELLNNLSEDVDGVVLGMPSTDTIKEVVGTSNEISTTLERTKIWKAFTPQIFQKNVLNKSFLTINQNIKYTDEASIVEANNGVLKMVQGSNDNIKLTFSEDIPLIKSILSSQGRGEDGL
tara:strand:+ start:1936 stop:2649 length:714 start_codon:yes stop_codon:yes gene_type:complete